jgi:hypothetical protein
MPALTPDVFLHRLLTAAILCAAPLAGASYGSARGLCAQDLDDVTITGDVKDERGAVVLGATVIAVRAAAGAARSVTTDGEGRYRIIELAPGEYTVRAAFAGFAPSEKTGVVALAGQTIKLDFTLRPAGVTAEQTISSETADPIIDTARTIVGRTIAREELEALPSVSRAALDFVFLTPGVTEEPFTTRDLAEDRNTSYQNTPEEAGAFALSGGAAYSNNITIDGLDNNDDRAARERFQPSLEAVEEVQVITNQFSAEYGRASGGRVNLRTRSGSNFFHGRLVYFFRDESLNANTWRNNSLGLGRLPLQEHNPGFSFSGPAILPSKYLGPLGYNGRGRTFFFTAYEYDTVLDTALIDTLVPVRQNALFRLPQPTTLAGRRREPAATPPNEPAELAPFIERVSTPLRSHAFTARVDHNFTEAHNGAFLYQFGRFRNLRQFGGGSRLAEALQGRTRQSDALAYSDNYVLSARAVNQARFQASRLAPAVKARGAGPVVLITINDPLAPDDPADRSGTLVAGSSTLGATDRRETRFQFQDALTMARGAHTLKLGGDAQLIRSSFIDLTDASGTYSFASAGDFLASTPSRFRQSFHAASTQRNTYAGLFVQDEWRPRPNLTLSVGLRYEMESILRDRNNLGPRAAVALDPFGSGKTVARAGFGVFFNRALLRTIDDFTLGAQSVIFDTDALRDAVTGRQLTPAERRAFIAANLSFPNTLEAASPLVQRFGARETTFARRLDPDLRIPESYQASIGFEREAGRAFVIEVNYTYNRGVHLWREFNANAPQLPPGRRDFTEYLTARDFANFRNAAGVRPIYNASTAGDLVRFTLVPFDPARPDAVGRVVEFGVPVSLINLNSISSGTAVDAALAALGPLRPDPGRGQIEQLAAIGNSFYHGLTIEARRRLTAQSAGFKFVFRAAYTLSRLIDDGAVNTSDALRPGDFRAERARSLLDRRHRFVLSGTLDTPRWLGGLRFAPVLRIASGAPFNISLGGADRNLDDVGNDRPVFTGALKSIRVRQPGDPLDPALAGAFALPAIGRAGTLPRNAGLGPGLFLFDVNVTRAFRFTEHTRLRPVIEIDNLLNRTVFSFGAEFINFNALGPAATAEQQKAFRDSFLVPTRTLRPRSIRLGLRFDF